MMLFEINAVMSSFAAAAIRLYADEASRSRQSLLVCCPAAPRYAHGLRDAAYGYMPASRTR